MTASNTLMNDRSLEAIDQRSVLHPFSMLHTQTDSDVVVFESAKGLILTDTNGTEYLDGAAGLWCTNIGYGREEIADAVSRQMKKTSSIHSFARFSHEPLVRLTDRLLQLAPEGFSRVLFGNSGSDANDTQIKLVRRYNNLLGRPKKKKSLLVIALITVQQSQQRA